MGLWLEYGWVWVWRGHPLCRQHFRSRAKACANQMRSAPIPRGGPYALPRDGDPHAASSAASSQGGPEPTMLPLYDGSRMWRGHSSISQPCFSNSPNIRTSSVMHHNSIFVGDPIDNTLVDPASNTDLNDISYLRISDDPTSVQIPYCVEYTSESLTEETRR